MAVRRPSRAQTRAQRRRALLITRMGRAQTPAERLGVAYGYARAAIQELPPHQAEMLASELVDALVSAADRATTRQKGPR
ncbi:hypothetical protein JQS43_24395 [Natronosporangium hydrolyticum]|uniref:Uncharacterized protein n=1 Tax=Natronosporangium hydrolyticum TaxID=2811111 RepID=A0A895YEJ9_9ACTN|nr:hypothetical protein [Natronosporangium hydrolyticum]QSB14575.1 hypothetical protein JQS43_24395 [Natronosporangium hydrolyticum]